MDNTKIIEKEFNRITQSKLVQEAVLIVENTKGDFSQSLGFGGKNADSPLFMASVAKLFTTACILILQKQEKLSLNDPLGDYFEHSALNGLHIYKGNEYSHRLTISNLLFQTSGLPDWYEEGGAKKLVIKQDFSLSLEDKLEKTRKLSPHFAPASTPKAYYSDINFDLLGEIIEQVTQMPLNEVYQNFIFKPLGMDNTYLPTSEEDFFPKVYYKNQSLYRPKMILSGPASGACISTAYELLRFLKAFFGGGLFPKSIFDKLSDYKKLQWTMGPICYGGGYMQIPLGGLATLFMGKGELIGHSGSTSCAAFYYLQKDLYFVCDFNQMVSPGLPIRFALKLAMKVK